MLSVESVDLLLKSAKHYEVKKIGNYEYHISGSGARPLEIPTADRLHLLSLTQVVNLLKLSPKDRKLAVNVDGYNRVSIYHVERNENNKLVSIGESSVQDLFEDFPFENKMSQEDFIINLMTKFCPDAGRDEIIKTVSVVKDEASTQKSDDGFSQSVNVKAGAVLVKTETLKNLWDLKTYKTFPEIDQPTIPYILRLHKNNSGGLLFALYDCDGGAWKVETAKKVREYLLTALTGLDHVSVL